LFENFRIKELIEVNKGRTQALEIVTKYEDLSKITRDEVRRMYKKVIHEVSKSAKITNIKIRGHVDNFRFLDLHENIKNQSCLIEEQRKQLEEQRELIKSL
jgi:hypothetical protein